VSDLIEPGLHPINAKDAEERKEMQVKFFGSSAHTSMQPSSLFSAKLCARLRLCIAFLFSEIKKDGPQAVLGVRKPN